MNYFCFAVYINKSFTWKRIIKRHTSALPKYIAFLTLRQAIRIRIKLKVVQLNFIGIDALSLVYWQLPNARTTDHLTCRNLEIGLPSGGNYFINRTGTGIIPRTMKEHLFWIHYTLIQNSPPFLLTFNPDACRVEYWTFWISGSNIIFKPLLKPLKGL